MEKEMDIITTPPTLETPIAKAWKIDLDAVYALFGKKRDVDGSHVASWIIEAPWGHPFWHSYGLQIFHLRPLPKHDFERLIYLEGATHEMQLEALDPSASRQIMIGTGEIRGLTPLNFAAQIIAGTDAEAAGRIEQAVKMVLAGKLSPDTDFISQWAHLFGSNMLKEFRNRPVDIHSQPQGHG